MTKICHNYIHRYTVIFVYKQRIAKKTKQHRSNILCFNKQQQKQIKCQQINISQVDMISKQNYITIPRE